MSDTYKDPMEAFNTAANKAVESNIQEAKSPAQVAEESIAEQAEEANEEIVNAETEESQTEESTESSETQEEVVEETTETSTELEPEKENTLPENETSNEVIQEGDTIENWDSEGTTEETEGTVSFDYKSFAQEAGLEVSSKEEFIAQVNEIKAKADAPNPIDKLPDNLKKAIEIANQDGDFMQYLGVTSVDYDAVSDVALVENNFANILNQRDGNVDREKLDEWMDDLTESQIAQKGADLRNALKGQQEQSKGNIEAEVTRNREAADKELKGVLDGLTEINGFKYSPTNKKRLYDGISSGNMIQEMFHGKDGKLDMNKVVKAYANHLDGDKQTKYLKQRTTVQAKKDLLDRVSNKQVEPKAGEAPRIEKKEVRSVQQNLGDQAREGKNPFEIFNK